MTESILRAVGIKLADEYEDIKIYNEAVKQGFETPCFCLFVKNVSDSLFRGKRYKYSAEIEIRYYADERVKRCVRAEELFRCLESLDTEELGLVRGGNMRADECDDYYSFVVCYEFFYVRAEDEDVDMMGSLDFRFDGDE